VRPYDALGVVVHRAGWFVEDEQFRAARDCARDQHALLLTFAERAERAPEQRRDRRGRDGAIDRGGGTAARDRVEERPAELGTFSHEVDDA
jgi:hypothetical protein